MDGWSEHVIPQRRKTARHEICAPNSYNAVVRRRKSAVPTQNPGFCRVWTPCLGFSREPLRASARSFNTPCLWSCLLPPGCQASHHFRDQMRCRPNWRWNIARPTSGKSLFSDNDPSRTGSFWDQLLAFDKWDK